MIDVAKLKELILQKAIFGKLINYKFDDNLKYYALILKESSTLHLKANSIDQERIPFELPSHWRWIQIGLIGKMGMGQTILTSDLDKSGNAVYSATMSDTYFGYINPSKNKINLAKGDIVIPARGNSIGFVKSVKEDYSTCTQTTMYLSIPNSLYKEWIYYALLARKNDLFEHGGMAIPQITIGVIKNELIPIPPVEEQKQIVKKLDEIFVELDKIDENQTKLQSIQDKMESKILKLAIQGKLVEQRPEEGTGEELFNLIQQEKQQLIKEGKIKKEKMLPAIEDDEIPFDIPSTWKWVRWGDLSFRIQYGYNAPAKETGRLKMVRISDIQNEKVLWETVPYCDINENEIQDYLLKNNDILFARTGGTVGKSYIVSDVHEEAVFAGYLIRTQYSENLVPMYLKFFMNTSLYWRQLRDGTIATAQPNCNGKTLSKMIVPLPPYDEQKRIVEKLNDVLLHLKMEL